MACFEEKRTLAELRKRAKSEESPFHPTGLRVKVGLPGQPADHPGDGKASACRYGGLYGRTLQVVDCEQENRSTEVHVSGHYRCKGKYMYPDLQLNPADSNSLFGTNRQEYECAVVFPLSQ